ncbi:MAG: flagellar export protein FliJ [Lachnospiraceae bacterium]|nr:flagellar export protein FliJ [Lachnospiraceae bacterium]
MAKFIYRMQSILELREKLEEQARNNFAEARLRLDEEEEKLEALNARLLAYEEEGRRIREDLLDILKLNENQNAVDRMKERIELQKIEVNKAAVMLEEARINLTEAMQETKIQNKLRENAFEEFKRELVAEEMKEVDELTSFTYGQKLKG